MKRKHPLSAISLRSTLAGVAALLASYTGLATPYATSLTNNAGIISFRLNQTTATNDTVLVISSGGTVTNILQSPTADPAKVLTRGLIVTNLGIAPGPFQVRITHVGSGQIRTNGAAIPFNAPRGVAVNRNPGSPYFGWVYVANATTGAKGDGLFAYSADLADILGQGTTARNGGYTGFASSTSWSPYQTSVAPDDTVLVCDNSDATGNLIGMDPQLSTFSYVLKQIQPNGSGGFAASPVGPDNNHGGLTSALIVGTGANRVLYTMDEDYQRDTSVSSGSEWNSVWKYDIGDSPLPWSNAPVTKLMTPHIYNFGAQNENLEAGPNGWLYVVQRRANSGQYSLYIVNPANPIDPDSYTGRGGYFWDSQTESQALGFTDDLLRDVNAITVSSDGRWLAGIVAAGSSPITGPDGGTVTNAANDIILVPLTNGIPNLPQRVVYRYGGAGNGRALSFDAANNLYISSSGLGIFQALDIGESATVTTTSDGQFTMVVPANEVSVTATVPLAYEAGAVPGAFELRRVARTLNVPLTVAYTITGSAANGTDIVTLTNKATFAAGVSTVTIQVTPVDDATPEVTESVVLSLAGGDDYSVTTPNSAEVLIVDNEPAQVQIAKLSTSLYEGNPNDYAAVKLSRYGDTNLSVTVDAANFTFSGGAALNTDFYLTNLPVTFDPGVRDQTVALLYPIDNAIHSGNRDIQVTLLAGAGFTVTNNIGTTTLVDDEVPAETVLWSENFNTDTTANWAVRFGNLAGVDDYTATFNFDYSSLNIPPAPRSGADTHGLFLTVNKGGLTSAAGVNVYPRNQTFSGNFALRFDMFLIMGAGSFTTEYALMGINHSGNQINWFRNSGNGFTNSVYDGLWAYVESDGASLGNNTTVFADYVLNTAPVVDNAGVWGPTVLAQRAADTLEDVFKTPPWAVGAGTGGVPANQLSGTTPSWAQVELSQVNNVVTLKINNTVIFSHQNATTFKDGTIMLGYDDPFDSNGPTDAGVVIDNVRVVRLVEEVLIITQTRIVDGKVQIDFTWGSTDPVSTFKLYSAPEVTGQYTEDTAATVSLIAPGPLYRVTAPLKGASQFYRVVHQ
jgi:hypothetical protein